MRVAHTSQQRNDITFNIRSQHLHWTLMQMAATVKLFHAVDGKRCRICVNIWKYIAKWITARTPWGIHASYYISFKLMVACLLAWMELWNCNCTRNSHITDSCNYLTHISLFEIRLTQFVQRHTLCHSANHSSTLKTRPAFRLISALECSILTVRVTRTHSFHVAFFDKISYCVCAFPQLFIHFSHFVEMFIVCECNAVDYF